MSMNTQVETDAVDTAELISGVACGSLVVRMAVSIYTGRIKDRSTQRDVISNKMARSNKAASVYKSLFAECKELEAISNFSAKARAEHYKLTKPWDDYGTRLLPTALLERYANAKAGWEDEFNVLVAAFLAVYDDRITAAAFQLGDLFDRAEYPPVSIIKGKFRIQIDYEVLPTAGDWRLDMEAGKQRDLVAQYEKNFTHRLEAVQLDNWKQLHEILRKFSVKLDVVRKDDGTPDVDAKGEVKRNRLFDSLLDNALETCDLMKSMNMAKDPELEHARLRLQNMLHGVTMEDLRESEGKRAEVKAKMDAMLGMFDWSGLGEE